MQFPAARLKELSIQHEIDQTSVDFAHLLDRLDHLRLQRDRFEIPKKKNLPNFCDVQDEEQGDQDCIYLCGQSLGLCPKSARQNVLKVMDNWASLGVHTHTEGYLPASYCDLPPKEIMARLVGAESSQVTIMNGLTVNLHILLTSFYRPNKQRYKIFIEQHAFPSDIYAVRSQVEMHGLDPSECIVFMKPKAGEHLLDESDIERLIDQNASTTSVILLPGLQYYTGQWIDVPRLTTYAKSRGILVGVDLAHSVGNISLQLDTWNVDFACWCTYKYLCSGPGGFAGIYVNRRFTDQRVNVSNDSNSAQPCPTLPAMKGWWGNKIDTKFNMAEEFDPIAGADVFKLSNPPPLLAATLMASLEIFDEVTLDKIIEKQKLITGYLEHLLYSKFPESNNGKQSVKILTPREISRRGSQLSLAFALPLNNVQEKLEKRGIVCDVRLPNVMRVTPAPLYTSYLDVYRFVNALDEIFNSAN